MVDAARLRGLLSRLRARLAELQPYAERDSASYLSDSEAVYASKYLLLPAIEDALSAANHVIASQGYRAPTDYADAFRSLRESKVLGAKLADRLEAMARFRNLLIHQYAEVDDRRVHEFLRQDLHDLDDFIAAILDAFSDSASAADERKEP
jgi:uncharacterized protein YutE (UPF0331/DUF86 family)